MPTMEKSSSLSGIQIVSWNMQAFFDGSEGGGEYAEYTAKAGWNEEKYRARLQSVKQALVQWLPEGPDVLALLEVENIQVLKDIATALQPHYQYCSKIFTSSANSSIGIGVLTRLPVIKSTAHSVILEGQGVPRPVLEIELQICEESLVLFVCHWKSKLGDLNETETLRQAAAAIVHRRIEEIEHEQQSGNSKKAYLVLGDLNENFDEFSRQQEEYLTALLPDSEAAFQLARSFVTTEATGAYKNSYLLITSQKPPVARYFEGQIILYSPWYDSIWHGSYMYQSNWETIDQVLIPYSLLDGTGWEYASFSVADCAPFTNAGGAPDGYNPRLNKGLSDHLPILVQLKKVN